MWSSRYFGSNEPLSTSGKPERDLILRIDDALRERIAAAPPKPLDPAIAAAIEAVERRYR